MTGLTMMLNALGVKIDPEEIERMFNELKTAIPDFAAKAQTTLASIDIRLETLNNRNIDILARLQALEERGQNGNGTCVTEFPIENVARIGTNGNSD